MARRESEREQRPLLVVAAWAPELRALPATSALRRAPWPVARAVVGVGLIEAAAGAARAIAKLRPRAVVLIGTAGRYAGVKEIEIGGVASAARLHLASLGVARGDAYLPPPLPAVVESSARLRQQIARELPPFDVACPLGITKTRAAARRLAQATGAALENLEAFAVGRAAAAARVPFAAILGITNDVGPDAHAQWRANAEGAAAAACAVVADWARSRG